MYVSNRYTFNVLEFMYVIDYKLIVLLKINFVRKIEDKFI